MAFVNIFKSAAPRKKSELCFFSKKV